MMGGLLLFLGVAGIFIFGLMAESKKEKQKRLDADNEADEFIKQEIDKPKFRVYVLTKTRQDLYTEFFDPNADVCYWGMMGYSVETMTSKQNAEACIERIITSGRYKHTDGRYIPLCEIESLKAVSE